MHRHMLKGYLWFVWFDAWYLISIIVSRMISLLGRSQPQVFAHKDLKTVPTILNTAGQGKDESSYR